MSHDIASLTAVTTPNTKPPDAAASAAADAWQAAQRILSAINFDSSTPNQLSAEEVNFTAKGICKEGETLIEAPAGSDSSISVEPRAALQAQLVLLASHLAEIAEEEGVDVEGDLNHGWFLSITDAAISPGVEVQAKQEDMEISLVDMDRRLDYEGEAG
jgi:hypothetical protein